MPAVWKLTISEKLDSVVELKYGSGGIRTDSNVSDLSALAQMKSLKMLWITGSEVDLTQLAGADLRVLRLDVTRIRGLMSVKYSLLWLLLAVGLVIAAAFIENERMYNPYL